MNTITKQQRLDSYIKLAQEWKLSGMTQSEFALRKGISINAFRYRLKKVRNEVPEKFNEPSLGEIEFVPLPDECLAVQSRIIQSDDSEDQPVMMIQSSSASLQVTNRIAPNLLKAALEVILSC